MNATRFALACSLVALLGFSASCTRASESQPSFPDRSIQLRALPSLNRTLSTSNGGARTDALPNDPVPPFSWDQTVVLREGALSNFLIHAYDPGFNPVEVVRNTVPEIEPFQLQPGSNFSDFGSVIVQGWDPDGNRITVGIPAGSGGITDTLFFRVHVGGLSDNISYPLNIEIRRAGDGRQIRSRSVLLRGQGIITSPGDYVRFKWSKSIRGGKDQEYRFEISGRSGKAAELSSVPEAVTSLQALRFRPVVLGHYVGLVSPWDSTRSPFEQRAGSTSNGAIVYCRQGSENLAPVSDGLFASTFTPAVGEAVTAIAPNATDPETAVGPATGFSGNVIDFGDGTGSQTFDGSTAHTFGEAGIYRALCKVHDFPVPDPPNADIAPGPDGEAEDLFVVGAAEADVPGKGAGDVRVACSLKKSITQELGGEGEPNKDKLTMTWTGISANVGDRLVFSFNRNRFGRMHTDPDPHEGETDDRIILSAQRHWSGITDRAAQVQVAASRNMVRIVINAAALDRTGDPRFGGAERSGDAGDQRIAVCVIPVGYPSDPVRAYVMRSNDLLRYRVKGGSTKGRGYDPEISLTASSVRSR